MLPRLRLVVATVAAVLALIAAALGVLSGARTGSVFAIGLRSAQGSPIERALPEPPDWKQLVALAASRRADELNRLLALPASEPVATPAPEDDAGAPVVGAQDVDGDRAITRVAPKVDPNRDPAEE
jgi:hypothetical protein